jgi:hypothetical protein
MRRGGDGAIRRARAGAVLRARGCGAAATEQPGERVPELCFTREDAARQRRSNQASSCRSCASRARMRRGGDGAIRRPRAGAALRERDAARRRWSNQATACGSCASHARMRRGSHGATGPEGSRYKLLASPQRSRAGFFEPRSLRRLRSVKQKPFLYFVLSFSINSFTTLAKKKKLNYQYN